MDWEDLKFFAELARSGSLSGAARALKVDHSTVARRVAALEQTLATRLFDRLPRGYSLTPEGSALAARVSWLQEEIRSIERMMAASDTNLHGKVRISAPPAFSSHFLVPRLPAFRLQYPQIELEIVPESRAVNLAQGEAEIAIRMMQPEGASMIVRRLGTFGYGLYGASRIPEDEWSFIGYGDALEHVPQQRWLRRLADGRPLVFRASDLTCLLSAVTAGIGVAVLPCFLASAQPGLVKLSVEDAPPSRDLWLVVHDDLRRSPRVRAVIDYIVALIETERHILDPGGG